MARGPAKGVSNNPNGRPKGIVNKDIAPLREKFQQLLDGYGIELMLKDLKALEPAERLRIVTGLSEFIIPKLQRSDVTAKVETEVKQIFDFGGQQVTF